MKTKCPHCFRNLAAIFTFLLVFSSVVFSQTCTYTWGTQTSGTANLLQSVSAPSGNVCWIAGATATVRLTTDGGTTWVNGNPNPGVINGDIYGIWAIDGTTALLTTSPAATYIYRTSNAGVTWTQVFTQAGGFIDAIVMANATTGYAYGDPVSARWSLWKTVNGGVTWDSTGMYLPQVASEAGWNNAMSVVGNNIWFGTNNTKVYHSTNAGATGSWTAGATTGNLSTYGVWFTSATNGICVGTIVQKTTDGGTTWVNGGAVAGTGNMTSIGGSGNYWWLTRGNNTYGSTDFGATWTGAGYTGTQALWATSITTAGSCLTGWSVGAAGTLLKVTGVPAIVPCSYSWGTQTSGTANLLQSVSAPSGNVCWIAGATATVRLTTDGGTTWVNGNPNPGVINGDIYGIWAIDGTTALLTTSPAATYIYRTSNAGVTWTQVFTQAGGFIDAIVMSSPTVGYAYGDPVSARWSLWKTVNGGVTWDSTGMYLPQVASEAGWNNAMSVVGNNIWFGTNNTKVYRSTNAGATGSWTAGVTTGNLSTYGVWFTSATNGICVGTIVQTTTDGGTTWVNGGTVAGTGNMTSIGGNGSNWWLTRGNNTYGSTDFGATWTGAGYTGTQALWATSITTSGSCLTGWSVGAAGTLLKLSGVPVGISNNNNQFPDTYKLEQNYPNPFNPTTNITFALPVAGDVELKIYDITGKEVTTLVNTFTNAGTHVVPFDASSLASGVYIYKISSGSFTDSKKMVLIK